MSRRFDQKKKKRRSRQPHLSEATSKPATSFSADSRVETSRSGQLRRILAEEATESGSSDGSPFPTVKDIHKATRKDMGASSIAVCEDETHQRLKPRFFPINDPAPAAEGSGKKSDETHQRPRKSSSNPPTFPHGNPAPVAGKKSVETHKPPRKSSSNPPTFPRDDPAPVAEKKLVKGMNPETTEGKVEILQKRVRSLSQENVQLRQMFAEQSARISQQSATISQQSATIAQQSFEIDDLHSDVARLQSTIEGLRKDNFRLRSELKTQESSFEDFKEETSRMLKTQAEMLKTQGEMLKVLTAERENDNNCFLLGQTAADVPKLICQLLLGDYGGIYNAKDLQNLLDEPDKKFQNEFETLMASVGIANQKSYDALVTTMRTIKWQRNPLAHPQLEGKIDRILEAADSVFASSELHSEVLTMIQTWHKLQMKRKMALKK